jgi:type II secretory pathway component PulM
MRAWWDGLRNRERLMVAIGGGLLVLLMLYLLGLEPAVMALEGTRDRVEEQKELHFWMRDSQVRIKALEANQRSAPVRDNRSLFTVIDQEVRRHNLGTDLTSLEPSGTDQVSLGFDAVSFDQLVYWLDQMETQGIALIDSLAITRGDELGKVEARLTLRRPTS